jgi:hypothetical protein
MRPLLSVLILFSAILRAGATIDVSLQMQLGNPSGALMDTNNHDHYLIQRSVETIDYSDNVGEPIWTSLAMRATLVNHFWTHNQDGNDSNLTKIGCDVRGPLLKVTSNDLQCRKIPISAVWLQKYAANSVL